MERHFRTAGPVLWAFFLVWLAGSAWPLDADLAISDFIHETWTMEDGLPQNSVSAIVQTRDGYLWLATQEGLARFDGVRFVVYDRSNTDEIGHNSVRALLEGADGSLWIGTHGGGLTRLAEGRFTLYSTDDGLPNPTVRALCEDQHGGLWVGTSGGGLGRLHDGTFTVLTTADGLPSDYVRSLYLDDDTGVLWIGTSNGLGRLEDGRLSTFKVDDGLPVSMVASIIGARDGGLWIGTDGGLCRLQDGRFSTFGTDHGLTSNQVISLYEDPQGNLWIGTNGGGLNRLRNGVFSSFTRRDGLADDVVRSVVQDREGELWIGTLGGGLNRLRKGKFSTLSPADGLVDAPVFALLQAQDESIWLGTLGAGLNRVRGRAVETLTTADGLSSDLIVALAEDREGGLWIGTNGGGLNRLADGRISVFDTGNGLSNNRVYSVAEDRDGALWIGTDGGVNRFKDGKLTVFGVTEGLSVSAVGPILAAADGTVWVGTDGGGLNRLRDGRVDVLTIEDGLSSDFIWSLHEGHDGTLWIGTRGGGLNCWKEGRIATFTTRDGFFNDAVFSLVEDELGYLWMTCNKGVFRVSISELWEFAEGRRSTFETEVYGVADGMESAECNGGGQPAAWRMADGTLWFPTLAGVAIIDPDNIPVNTLPPPVVCEELLADGEVLAAGPAGTVSIPPGTERFELHYTALSFPVPERLRFRYKLEGLDTEWVDAGSRRVAYYTRIPAGRYSFRVIAANDDGVWNEEGATLQVTVDPFVWETVWFRALCGLAVLLLVLSGHRLRLRYIEAQRRALRREVAQRTRELERSKEELQELNARIQEADRMKSEFLAKMSHELRTPLNSIIGFSEIMLMGSTGELGSKQRSCATNISTSGRHLLQLINNLLDLSKIEAGRMELHRESVDLAGQLAAAEVALSSLFEKKRHVLETVLAPGLPQLYADVGVVRQVLLNLLSNAHKFTPEGGGIRVEARVASGRPGFVEVAVVDTGQGIRAEELPFIFDEFTQAQTKATGGERGTGLGLAVCKSFVELHGGIIWAESEVGRGSRFCFTLPTVELVREIDSEGEEPGSA